MLQRNGQAPLTEEKTLDSWAPQKRNMKPENGGGSPLEYRRFRTWKSPIFRFYVDFRKGVGAVENRKT